MNKSYNIVTNLNHLKQLIFNEYVTVIPLGFTFTGADVYPVLQDKITNEVYVKHTDNCYYTYNAVDQAIKSYLEFGYKVSYDLREGV